MLPARPPGRVMVAVSTFPAGDVRCRRYVQASPAAKPRVTHDAWWDDDVIPEGKPIEEDDVMRFLFRPPDRCRRGFDSYDEALWHVAPQDTGDVLPPCA